MSIRKDSGSVQKGFKGIPTLSLQVKLTAEAEDAAGGRYGNNQHSSSALVKAEQTGKIQQPSEWRGKFPFKDDVFKAQLLLMTSTGRILALIKPTLNGITTCSRAELKGENDAVLAWSTQ